MLAVMAEQVRLVITTDPELRDALRLLAAKLRREMSEIATEILRDALREELAEIEQSQKKTVPKGKRPGN